MCVYFQGSIHRDDILERAMKTVMDNEVVSKSYPQHVCDLGESWDSLIWPWDLKFHVKHLQSIEWSSTVCLKIYCRSCSRHWPQRCPVWCQGTHCCNRAWWGNERNIKPDKISLKAKIFISSEFYHNKSGWANTMEKLYKVLYKETKGEWLSAQGKSNKTGN